MAENKRNAPGWSTGSAPTSNCDTYSLPAQGDIVAVSTPAEARRWEANAPLTAPEYWLGRSHGYVSGYYDALEDLDNWKRGNSLLKPGVFIDMTHEQAHGRHGGGAA